MPEHLAGFIYTLVVNKYATLKEIRDEYSIEEVISLYDACMTNLYNRYQSMKVTKGDK